MTNSDFKQAAISFTGGKDCTLALKRVKDQGISVAVLVTFSPPSTDPNSFKAHPISIVQVQAQALGIPHITSTIHGPDYLNSYKSEIRKLKETYGVDVLVTGDIMPVCSDFMERAVQDTDVSLYRPLWKEPQDKLLEEMWNNNFEVIVTCIDHNKVPLETLTRLDGKFGIGLPFTKAALDALCEEDVKISPAGENGELHTMVLNSPSFVHGKVGVKGEWNSKGRHSHFKVSSAELVPKN
ncbi:hypothetical protein BDB01DRAFT_830609 [Pilobolus umbonatus]|nr:hypothetical protein BDB01DRAFT_830609 [Pilobolus umbonatus]